MELFGLFWTAVGGVMAWTALRVSLQLMPTRDERSRLRKAKAKRLLRKVTWALVIAFAVVLCVSAVKGFRHWTVRREEEAVKRVVQDSQTYELSFYTEPGKFDKNNLNKYWVPAEQGGKTAKDIECAVQNLIKKHWYYGRESQARAFDIASVQVEGDKAKVSTHERWYLPIYHEEDGSPVGERKANQEWDVIYTLRKVNGRWLIQETTLPYKCE